MIKRFATMLFAAAATLATASMAHDRQVYSYNKNMDKLILSAVVAIQCKGKNRGKVLLSSRPSTPDERRMVDPDGISQSQIAGLISRTKATSVLPKGIECARVHMVSYAQLKEAFDRPAKHPVEFPVAPGVLIPIGPRTGFKDTFPDFGVLLRLSMPAYSQARDMAVVYFSEDCGGLCAHGEYVVLQRLKGKWKVLRRVNAWNS